jgi:hypothetical protein
VQGPECFSMGAGILTHLSFWSPDPTVLLVLTLRNLQRQHNHSYRSTEKDFAPLCVDGSFSWHRPSTIGTRDSWDPAIHLNYKGFPDAPSAHI